MSLHTFLCVILVTLIPALFAAFLAIAICPRRADDLLKRVVGDAPRFRRGGYAAMDERAPIDAERAS